MNWNTPFVEVLVLTEVQDVRLLEIKISYTRLEGAVTVRMKLFVWTAPWREAPGLITVTGKSSVLSPGTRSCSLAETVKALVTGAAVEVGRPTTASVIDP
jgi:hypothetical protein